MRFVCFCVALFLAIQVSSAVFIYEVLYRPSGTESGGEAVVLFNPSGSFVSLDSWSLATSVSSRDVFIKNKSIAPNSYFIIADKNWSGKRDGLQWPEADFEETMTLRNEDSGVALIDSNGSVIDAVGWGNTSLSKGTPALSVQKGFALVRVRNSNNNSNDFIESVPIFPRTDSLVVTAFVSDVPLISLFAEDDGVEEGVQVKLVGGGVRNLKINGFSEGEEGLFEFAAFSSRFEIVNGSFSFTIPLSFTFPAGRYPLVVRVNDREEVLPIEVLELKSLSVKETSVVFDVRKSSTASAKLHLENKGNVPLVVRLKAYDLRYNNSVIPAHWISFGGVDEDQTVLVPVEQFVGVEIKLKVPASVNSGRYVGLIEVKKI